MSDTIAKAAAELRTCIAGLVSGDVDPDDDAFYRLDALMTAVEAELAELRRSGDKALDLMLRQYEYVVIPGAIAHALRKPEAFIASHRDSAAAAERAAVVERLRSRLFGTFPGGRLDLDRTADAIERGDHHPEHADALKRVREEAAAGAVAACVEVAQDLARRRAGEHVNANTLCGVLVAEMKTTKTPPADALKRALDAAREEGNDRGRAGERAVLLTAIGGVASGMSSDDEELLKALASIEAAAERRGAAKAQAQELRDAAKAWPYDHCGRQGTRDWLNARADAIEAEQGGEP